MAKKQEKKATETQGEAKAEKEVPAPLDQFHGALTSAGLNDVTAQAVVKAYIDIEKAIAGHPNSKAMYYQRRLGMKTVLYTLGVEDDTLREFHKVMYPRAVAAKKSNAG